MDAELQKLIEEKKKLEQQISILKKNAQIYGCAKLDKDHFSTYKNDEWYVAIFCEQHDEWIKKLRKENGRWRSIIRHPDKKVVIEKIDTVIADLQGLKDKIKENEDE